MIYPPYQKPPMWNIDPGIVAYNAQRMGLPMPALGLVWGNKDQWNDLSGNNSNGGAAGNVSWLGNHLHFPGAAGDYVDIDSFASAIHGASTSHTWVFKIKPTNSDYIYDQQTPRMVISLGTYGDFYDGTAWRTIYPALTAGKWYTVAVVADAVKLTISGYFNGIFQSSDTYSPRAIATTDQIAIGSKSDGNPPNYNGDMEFFYCFPTVFTPSQVVTLSADPYGLVKQPRRTWGYVAAVGGYTVTANAGSYSITGQVINLLRDSIISSEAGSIALLGLSTNLLKGFVLGAEIGSITLTGLSTNVLKNSVVSIEASSIALTGINTDLLKGSLISVEAGSIILTGQDVTLTYSGGVYILTADSGSITLTGTQIDLLRTGRLPSGTGSIALTGINVDLLQGFLLGTETGNYTLTGTNVDLLRGFLLEAEADSYILTGTTAILLRAAKLGIGSGIYDLVGFNARLNYSEEQWKKIILRGLDVLSGQVINITGQYKEV